LAFAGPWNESLSDVAVTRTQRWEQIGGVFLKTVHAHTYTDALTSTSDLALKSTWRVLKRTVRENAGLRATKLKRMMKMPNDTKGKLSSWMTGKRGRKGIVAKGKASKT